MAYVLFLNTYALITIMTYETVVGLEIHAQLKTRSKMFCPCANDPMAPPPNSNVCPICLGHPGTLPVPNAEAIAKVMMVGLALGAQVATTSKFDRKHYFYPDLPKGYQISQYDAPLCTGGTLALPGLKRVINLRRIHIEEDTGRLTHDISTGASLIDFNRAGVPLMELVTEPDFRSAQEASAGAEELQKLFRYLGVADADMEKGQLRVEANISVRPEGSQEFGVKVEVKNLNSFRGVRDAIAYEVARHIKCLEKGQKIVQETRGWDPQKGVTLSQRGKEEASDYRYFAEPDIPPFNIPAMPSAKPGLLPSVAELKSRLPELPWERREFLNLNLGLALKDAEFFVIEKEVGDFLALVVETWRDLEQSEQARLAKKAADLLATFLQGWLKDNPKALKDTPLTPQIWADFTEAALGGSISNVGGQKLFAILIKQGGRPSEIIEREGLKQVSDESVLAGIIQEVLKKNQKVAEEYKAGKTPVLQFLVGQVMAATQGKASPQVAAELLKKALGG